MNNEKNYEAMTEETKHREALADFRKKYGAEAYSDLETILTNRHKDTFAHGYIAASKQDMRPLWDDAGRLLDDIEGELSGCLAIANELHTDLEEEHSQYTDLAYALWSSLHHLAKDVSFRHNAECRAAKMIRENSKGGVM